MNPEQRLHTLYQRLTEALSPTVLEIEDESAQHIGHVGAQEGGGHFKITIASNQFSGKTPVACHRLVYAALGELMEREVHALKIVIAA